MSDLSRSCSGFPPLADPLQVEALSKPAFIAGASKFQSHWLWNAYEWKCSFHE